MTTPYPGNSNWPSDFQAATITGKYVDIFGTPLVGKTITFIPTPEVIKDYTNKVQILGAAITVVLNAAGAFSIAVPATDDPDIDPLRWNYKVVENFPPGRTYYIEAPMGTTVDLTSASTVPEANGVYIARGPAGPAGGVQYTGGQLYDQNGNPITVGVQYVNGKLLDQNGNVIPTVAAKTLVFSAWGNSLTNQGDNFGTRWVTGVGTDLGNYPFYNGGIAGQSSTEIAMRQGGLDITLSVANNTIPASGNVTVTPITTGVWRARAAQFPGSLMGVPGVLSHDAGSAGGNPDDPDSTAGVVTWTFARTSPGSAVAVPPGTSFHCTTGDPYKGSLNAIWILANNPSADPTLTIGLRDLDLMVNYCNNKFVVMTEHIRTNEVVTPIKLLINKIIRQRYPNPGQVVDLEVIMSTYGIIVAGVTATSDDLTALANYQSPPSLMSDTAVLKTHFNTAGYGVVRLAVDQGFALQGAVVGLFPAIKCDTVGAAAAASNITGSSATLTIPAAITRATAYHWEYRPQGASSWLYGPNTLGLSCSITGLNVGTTYEFRYTPYNIAGGGPASVMGTFATTGTPPVLLASDNFTGADNTNLNNRALDYGAGGSVTGLIWATNNAFINIVNNKAASINTTNFTQALFDAGVTDGRISVYLDTLPTATGNLLIYARTTTATNGFIALLISDTGQVRLNVNNGTTSTVVLLGAGTAVAGDTWDLSAIGTTLTVRQNGAPVIGPLTNSVVTTGTKWGINLIQLAKLDNLRLYDK